MRAIPPRLDEVINRSLGTLLADLSLPDWYGREREIVSLFAFGHLLRAGTESGVLSHPTQIGIEVAVPQMKEKPNKKSYVCKDVVIWSGPKMTCWTKEGRNSRYPLCVIEFKSINRNDDPTAARRKAREHRSDLEWLRRTSELAAGFVGYAVFIDQHAARVTLICSRALNGSAIEKWLSLEQRDPEAVRRDSAI